MHAAQLVNINTADLATLETLPGVGASIAQSIIDNRPYASIEEVSRASGIGEPGSSSYEKIKDLITVGDTSTTQTTTIATSSTQTQAQTQTQTAASPGPPALTVRITADRRSAAGGGSYFSATAYGTEDLPLPNPRFIWNFGDGTAGEGARAFHTYAYPGKYAVSATAAYNYSSGMARTVVEAVGAAVSLEAEGDGSLLLRNNSPQDANVGLWTLVDAGKSYIIPGDTIILAGEGVRFAASITNLPGSPSAVLLYPNNAPAAAASVAKESPLRGERIIKDKVSAAPPKPPESAAGEVLGESTSSAPATQNGGSPLALWGSLAALGGLLVAGGAGAHYLRRPAVKGETSPTAEEFDIVD